MSPQHDTHLGEEGVDAERLLQELLPLCCLCRQLLMEPPQLLLPLLDFVRGKVSTSDLQESTFVILTVSPTHTSAPGHLTRLCPASRTAWTSGRRLWMSCITA